ncbi:hypothetical protein K435DRAFT_796719 [Dendrothele bispora CBS 962.96]|uniref:Uncharacterized protein n=1 Tax=Dendrothele bispora (strain CBS 962.96) TaxID=1314807 RepID=A0A4S8M4T0_DENBC|nr:hypothetical protein K435DRAFT_796719 [Dendrothele bispora CBS 962.96]
MTWGGVERRKRWEGRLGCDPVIKLMVSYKRGKGISSSLVYVETSAWKRNIWDPELNSFSQLSFYLSLFKGKSKKCDEKAYKVPGLGTHQYQVAVAASNRDTIDPAPDRKRKAGKSDEGPSCPSEGKEKCQTEPKDAGPSQVTATLVATAREYQASKLPGASLIC